MYPFKISTYIEIIIATLILFIILGTLPTLEIKGDSLNTENTASATTPIIINVLIYDGDGVISNSVDGVEDCLENANMENIVSNVHFNYSTTKEINSEILSHYDILIMPGGLVSTYLKDPDINVNDLKEYVYNGKGYVGICAGSYVASSHVDGYYDGWGIASHINCKSVNYVGNLPISLTENGKNILNSSDMEELYEWNGPAMYKTTKLNGSLAEYADNKTCYQNYAAIMEDQYGSGRVILSGPHPELNTGNSKILVNMIMWASKKI
ncbi:MAG: BPL-N domain-containing protein [Methanobacterium sp.]